MLNLWEFITHGHLAEIEVEPPRVRLLFSRNARLLRKCQEMPGYRKKYKKLKMTSSFHTAVNMS